MRNSEQAEQASAMAWTFTSALEQGEVLTAQEHKCSEVAPGTKAKVVVYICRALQSLRELRMQKLQELSELLPRADNCTRRAKALPIFLRSLMLQCHSWQGSLSS